MNNVKKIDVANEIREYSDVKFIGYRDGKEEIIELDNLAKSMLIGYFTKKRLIKKEQ